MKSLKTAKISVFLQSLHKKRIYSNIAQETISFLVQYIQTLGFGITKTAI